MTSLNTLPQDLVAGVDSAAQCTEGANAPRAQRELHQIDPLVDVRWDELVESHSRASLFHSSAWLRALQDTYGYRPVAFSRFAPGEELRGAVLFCEVDSWLTGRRLVSLPFSDHCDSLLLDENSRSVVSLLARRLPESRWRYIEVRPLRSMKVADAGWHASATYYFHRLDLRPDLTALYQNFHPSSTQRKIRRAEREGLTYREGSSDFLLNEFYRLLVATRKRHRIPPQPRKWYRNLVAGFGDDLKIRVAFKGNQAIAAMLTIRYKDTLYYKNGGSDAGFHNLGGMHLLFWKAIQDAKNRGLNALDFGRVDSDQTGLIIFKDRWGAVSSPLHYYRFSPKGADVHTFDRESKFQRKAINRFCAVSPSWLLPACGSLLYKHIG